MWTLVKKVALALCCLPVVGDTPAGIAADASGPKLTSDQIEFFEKKIRPTLAEHCYKCHSAGAEKIKGGLLLDSREGWVKGGDSGSAISPGKPDESLLIKAVRYTDPDLQMPPKEKLPDPQIKDFESWVAMGSPDPRRAQPGTTSDNQPRGLSLEE